MQQLNLSYLYTLSSYCQSKEKENKQENNDHEQPQFCSASGLAENHSIFKRRCSKYRFFCILDIGNFILNMNIIGADYVKHILHFFYIRVF